MRAARILDADSSTLDKKLKMRGHVSTCTKKILHVARDAYWKLSMNSIKKTLLSVFSCFFNWGSNTYDHLKFSDCTKF